MAAAVPESVPDDEPGRDLARNRLSAAHDAIEQALRFARGRTMPPSALTSDYARELLRVSPTRCEPFRLRAQRDEFEAALARYDQAALAN